LINDLKLDSGPICKLAKGKEVKTLGGRVLGIKVCCGRIEVHGFARPKLNKKGKGMNLLGKRTERGEWSKLLYTKGIKPKLDHETLWGAKNAEKKDAKGKVVCKKKQNLHGVKKKAGRA